MPLSRVRHVHAQMYGPWLHGLELHQVAFLAIVDTAAVMLLMLPAAQVCPSALVCLVCSVYSN